MRLLKAQLPNLPFGHLDQLVPMASDPVVVDISSDDEADESSVSEPLAVSYHLIDQWLNVEEGESVDNSVDLDQYLNPMDKSGLARPKRDVVRDGSDDDCMILDGDPDKPVAVDDDDKRDGGDGCDDLCIVGQKGQVACRDFPHSRHLCANFPFNTTSHEQHCGLCHCFVCDSPAPCICWGNGISLSDHCHATDKDESWKALRRSFKKVNSTPLPPQKLPVLEKQLTQHIRNPQPAYHRIFPPAPAPIQPVAASSLRPCFNTNPSTKYLTGDRPHQNPVCYRRRSPSSPSQRPHPIQRVNGGSLASSPMSCVQFKKVGTSGSGLISSSVTRPQQAGSNPNRVPRAVVQGSQRQPAPSFGPQRRPVTLPRSQSMPHTSQRSLCSPVEEDRELWKDMLANVAAELGVSDSISKSTIACEPYAASSQSPSIDTLVQYQTNPIQGMERTYLGPATFPSNTTGFYPGWLDSSAGQTHPDAYQEGDFQIDAMQHSDPLVHGDEVDSGDIPLRSFLAAIEESAPVPGKDAVLPEMDPVAFLSDLDCGWGSLANV